LRKSLKIATVAAVLFVAVGAVVLVYANSLNTPTANADDRPASMWNMKGSFWSDNNTICRFNNDTIPTHMGQMWGMRQKDLQLNMRLLQNATLSTVQGSVVSEFRGMLILDTSAGQVRVLLPKDWSLGDQVVGRVELFNGTFASPGQTVTLKVLKSDIFSNTNFSINIMLGYEAVNSTGTHAYAVLPFNIQPAS
jgi:hypothetical protein